MGWFGIFLIVCAFWFFRSPLPRAIAEAIRVKHGGGVDDGSPRLQAAVEGLQDEVRGLRDEVMELGERLDFTERMLADVRRRTVLPGAGS